MIPDHFGYFRPSVPPCACYWCLHSRGVPRVISVIIATVRLSLSAESLSLVHLSVRPAIGLLILPFAPSHTSSSMRAPHIQYAYPSASARSRSSASVRARLFALFSECLLDALVRSIMALH